MVSPWQEERYNATIDQLSQLQAQVARLNGQLTALLKPHPVAKQRGQWRSRRRGGGHRNYANSNMQVQGPMPSRPINVPPPGHILNHRPDHTRTRPTSRGQRRTYAFSPALCNLHSGSLLLRNPQTDFQGPSHSHGNGALHANAGVIAMLIDGGIPRILLIGNNFWHSRCLVNNWEN